LRTSLIKVRFNIGITTTAQVSPMASLPAIQDVSGASAQPGA
jgi:hypothetical protein